MTNRVYLIRHGENVANLTKEFSHKLVDYSLTDKGRLQARQTAEYFRGMNVNAIFTSPLKRAHETAQTIGDAVGLTAQVMEEFREINVGDFEKQPPSLKLWNAHNQILESWVAGDRGVRFPGGENHYELLQRMEAGLRAVLNGRENEDIIIVAHGGVFALTVSNLCPGGEFQFGWDQVLANCSISEIHFEPVNGSLKGVMVRWGSVEHLSGEATKMVSGLPTDGELPEE